MDGLMNETNDFYSKFLKENFRIKLNINFGKYASTSIS